MLLLQTYGKSEMSGESKKKLILKKKKTNDIIKTNNNLNTV